MTPSAEDRTDPLIGSTLAERYRLTRRIGEGGMGTVYEATHVVIDKPVAVKVLREKYVDRPEVAQRLVQEARLASSIRHEHIVDIADSGSTGDGRTFVVMELLDGQSLSELIRHEGPLPEPRALEIVRQVASALGAAHARSIVHRDVKPENIFLVERAGQDFVKVVDFGISKSMRAPKDQDEASEPESLRLTHTGMVLGTPLYMSPEQARGDEDLDHRIDVYALGVILYECLTGEVPFRGTNYNGIIAQVVNQEPSPPRQLRPELRISEAVERVVMKAMAKSRDARYATMEALEADLARVSAGEGVEAPIPARPPRKGGLRTSVIVAVAAGFLVALIAMFAAGRSTKTAPPPPVMVETPVAPAPQPPPPPPPKTVVVHVDTMPPGAEVRQGDRVFGAAPRDLLLPRSTVPAHLTFHLDGYDPAAADVVPSTDDAIRVQLTPKPKHARPHAPPSPLRTAPEGKADSKPSPDKKPTKNPDGETLPNPY
jgi:eukaryotic-like serine/threonine-protein kinase